MPAPVAGIHGFLRPQGRRGWPGQVPGSSPATAMTERGCCFQFRLGDLRLPKPQCQTASAALRTEFAPILRMPPAAAEHDRLGDDALVACQVLADDVDVVEAALTDGEDGGVAGGAGFQAAELGALERH